MLSWLDMGIAATDASFVLFTVVIMLVVKLVVKATMVVVTAINPLHMKARSM
jgi:hypothetical protein